MNIAVIPQHDYNVSRKEGFRTRDAHLYSHFIEDQRVKKIIILNRPISVFEILSKRKKAFLGNVLYRSFPGYLSKVNERVFVVNYFNFQLFRPLRMGKSWIPYIYGQKNYVDFINSVFEYLNINEFDAYTSFPFSVPLLKKIEPRKTIFDIVDNFMKHPELEKFHCQIEDYYKYGLNKSDKIITNSSDNVKYFKEVYGQDIELIPNGVDKRFAKSNSEVPLDLKKIKGKKVGYAGKMQSMFDTDLLVDLSNKYPEINFLLLGKILNEKWMDPLQNINNVYFLGDKKYELLPSYINNMDICIIPYLIDNQHGGDPIKFYEYFIANKPIISTDIGEISKYHNGEDVFICSDRNEFLNSFNLLLQKIDTISIQRSIPNNVLWASKAKKIVDFLER